MREGIIIHVHNDYTNPQINKRRNRKIVFELFLEQGKFWNGEFQNDRCKVYIGGQRGYWVNSR